MLILKFHKMLTHLLTLLLLTVLLCLQQCINAYRHKAANYELLDNDSRFISYQDLMSTSKRFNDPNTTYYSQMLFDVARNQVIVGARDSIYRMSFDLEPLERAVWAAPPEQIGICQVKGQSERLCRNYVRVLQSYGENQLYACGTNAFQPQCSWRQMENLTIVAYDNGVGKCPFNPHSSITSLMSSTDKMFVGTATDFSGGDPAILRTEVQPKKIFGYRHIVRTQQYNNNWLNNPHFVGSFEAGNFVYFLFREPAVEYSSWGKIIYSRIARVCKNDAGGDQILKNSWTSFVKARLNCSLPGEYPFYFDEIQGMTYSADEDVLYATFTTPANSIHGSAVCSYNLTSINAAFDGPFRYQDSADSDWRIVDMPHRSQFQCETPSPDMRYKRLLESSKFQLMAHAVQPMTEQPLYYSKLERFQHISLDTLQTKTEKVHVLFVSTDDKRIKKLSVKHQLEERRAQTCLIEVWQSAEYNGADGDILKMEYLKVTESLYLGTEQALIRIPAQRCSRHVSQSSCLNAMDPYCGWNELIERCTPQELVQQLNKFWLQPDTLQCPILNAPIDGAWSTWSEWYNCKKHGDDDGNCMCRTRECNNPQPQNGGRSCDGITTEVTNCTVHGDWTNWSEWSACSQTCGIAVKTRRRTCGNPKPAHGGRTCVGDDHQEMYCRHLPPCPTPKLQAIDGGWGPWGVWSECSTQCGGGFRIRRRECNDPVPQNDGQECPGCAIDYEVCNVHACPEVKKLSSWTPWLVEYNDSRKSTETSGTYVERRFRYVCRGSTTDVNSLRIALAKEETRTCHADGSCQRHHEVYGASVALAGSPAVSEEREEHGEWGPCSVTCGGGLQYRLHDVSGSGKHRGRHATQARVCNIQACEEAAVVPATNLNEVVQTHEWSCWTDWSPCSVTCGMGLRRRTRRCLGGHDKLCSGKAIEEEKCAMAPCTDFIGWSTWSPWSECSSEGIRIRHRKCMVDIPSASECRGAEFEKTACVPNEYEALRLSSSTSWPWIILLCSIIYVITIIGTFYLTKRFIKPVDLALNKNNTPVAPNYDSYANQYSSLPTKDQSLNLQIYEVRPKVKRQSSFNMCSPSPSKSCNTGTLTRNNMAHNHTPKVLAKTYNDCETGTLKRNSHQLNNYRSNIDDEKF
ncbi:semaphorin 5c isoform X1 [Bactrocera oleae]|uniref:semaphorin 5c isoform X1 n=1 Tax=Bactrocera oleae TaxID=104688 RepID=UPI00387E8C22